MYSTTGYTPRAFVLTLSACLLPVLSAAAAEYRFTNIADSFGEYLYLRAPSINEHGVVAFSAETHTNEHVVHTWSNGALETLYHRRNFSRFTAYDVQINNVGDVAFVGGVDDEELGVYRGNGGPLTTIAARSDGFTAIGNYVSFNDAGTVAFHSGMAGGGSGVFTGDGAVVTTIAHTNQGLTDLRLPVINDLDAVAYVAATGDDYFVYYHEEGQPPSILLQELDNPDFWFGESLAMNNFGQVVVVGEHWVAPAFFTLSIVDSQGLIPVADSTGPFEYFFSGTGINDNGDVAFAATLDDGRTGIFLGSDAVNDRVVIEGDSLFGETIQEIFFRGAFNNREEIAFRYVLTNGVEGVALATPVPEPSGWLLMTGICAIAALRRRSSQKGNGNPPWVKLAARHSSVMLALCAVCLLLAAEAQAKKPGGNGGNPNGGGAELELVELLPAGAMASNALSINDVGIVVGWVDEAAGFWDTANAEPAFSFLRGGAGGFANDVNENNQIVGSVGAFGSSTELPVYWPDALTAPIGLPLPAGFDSGSATSISRDGVIVGYVNDAQQTSVAAAIWRIANNSVLGPLVVNDAVANDVASLASGANRVVGQAADANDVPIATAWDLRLNPDGSFELTNSTTLLDEPGAEAFAITEAGDVAGIVRYQTNQSLPGGQAFVIREGSLKLLSNGGRNKFGEGRDLNDTDVVGATGRSSAFSPRTAARWDSRDRPEDLVGDYFGERWSSSEAFGINGLGNIVGGGRVADGSLRGWILRSPVATSSTVFVPEPSAAALLVVGVLGLALRKRRKHNGAR